MEKGLTYVTLEQEELGGTVAKYPRQKLVMTSPVDFPMHGKFNKLEISKEKLMEFWATVIKKGNVQVRTQEKVESIDREADGTLTIRSTSGGLPRPQRHPGARAAGARRASSASRARNCPKVMYGLIEAEAYVNANILVVGGGDSAVEAAMGLAYQKGNQVTLSYRQAEFSRLKERNAQRIREAMHGEKGRACSSVHNRSRCARSRC